jgi:hypothetical protein
MRTQIILLDGYDDLTSARDKLSFGSSGRIALVWPEHGHPLNSRLDLVRLQRCSRELGVQLALVTRDAAIRANAQELGIPVFRKVEKAQQETWRAGRRKKPPVPALRGMAAIREANPEAGKTQSSSPRSLAVRLAVFTVAILAVIGLAGFILPNASISVALPTQIQKIHWQAEAQPAGLISPGGALNAIPLETAEVLVEASDTAVVSGSVRAADKLASGKARFSNLTAQTVAVPAGTFLSATRDASLRFATSAAAQVPAGVGKTMDVTIQAVRAGSAGNLPKDALQALEGPLGLQLAVTNPAPTSGGSDQVYPAPSDADRSQLRQKLLVALRKAALGQAKSQLAEGSILVEDSLTGGEIVADQSYPPDRQPSDRLEQTLRARFTIHYLAAGNLQKAAAAELDAGLAAGFHPAGARPAITPVGQPATTADGRVHLEIDASRAIQPDLAAGQAAGLVRGLPVNQAAALLAGTYHLAQTPTIHVQPPVWPWMPFLPFRIAVAGG